MSWIIGGPPAFACVVCKRSTTDPIGWFAIQAYALDTGGRLPPRAVCNECAARSLATPPATAAEAIGAAMIATITEYVPKVAPARRDLAEVFAEDLELDEKRRHDHTLAKLAAEALDALTPAERAAAEALADRVTARRPPGDARIAVVRTARARALARMSADDPISEILGEVDAACKAAGVDGLGRPLPLAPCDSCGAPKQSPMTGVRCGACGLRRA